MTKITAFVEKGEPPEEMGSYGPISFINAEAKIFTKVLAIRLAPVPPFIVSKQQHGFITGRDTTSHINIAIAAFDIVEKIGTKLAMILLDAEKAFDHVVWDCQWATMGAFGIGELRNANDGCCLRRGKTNVAAREGEHWYFNNAAICRLNRNGKRALNEASMN
ncbi:hypothetical protein NDU88_008033 [Pleurodeles waltl]|uniref:Reverse transcriptase domain-containing protein n=1 Tax=Pleurodeles waltl TaxID=8319 RepID=A0AAV7PQQ3_PLEWA|nr:hypothetical protein NDU88_008033 [Pleurodeles waltl]